MQPSNILIIGAGLCGTLLAIRLAQRGHQVRLFEKRSDMRLADIAAGRSINLALSDRGLQALRMVGLEDLVRQQCIPMHGRMIHPLEGEQRLSRYSGRENEYINSVSRGGLNMVLLDEAEKMDNIELIFNHQCTSVDIEKGVASFRQEDGKKIIEAGDLIIGTDGAGSALRRSMIGHTTALLFNYSQDFLRHGYKELSIPPAEGGGYRIDKNSLHIWPRGQYMIIALPNMDGSFTVTMFMPYEGPFGFNNLDTEEKVIDLFEKQFPDLLPLIPDLKTEYFQNPVGTLGTIKCYPWSAYGKTLLMGDASHAIVPFYGQGMNASFEDVFVFDQVLDKSQSWDEALEKFQDERKPDTDAIADLALDNFYEMRDHVANKRFIKKRKLEMQLEQRFPEYFSKYSLVTFNEHISYEKAMLQGRKQDEILLEIADQVEREKWPLERVLAYVQEKTDV